MIKINLDEKDKKILEIGYLNLFCNGRNKKTKEFKDLINLENEKKKSITDLDEVCNSLTLDKLVKDYKNKILSVGSNKYINSGLFPLTKCGSKDDVDEHILKTLLLLLPTDIVRYDYNTLNSKNKKIKTLADLMQFNYLLEDISSLSISQKNEKVNKLKDWLNISVDSIKNFLDIELPLKTFDRTYIATMGISEYCELYDYCKKELKDINDFLSDYLNYSKYINGDAKVHYYLSSLMKVNVCPYCNRQFITVRHKAKRGTLTFDHFYREETYPIFKLSLYNLVPACYSCNSLVKGISNIEHLNPWTEGDDILKFKIEKSKMGGYGKLIDNYYRNFDLNGVTDAKICIDAPGGNEYANNSIKVFELNDIYQSHNTYAALLYARAIKYEGGSFKQELKKLLNKAGLVTDSTGIDYILYETVNQTLSSDLSRYQKLNIPLNKLRNDILDEVKLKMRKLP